MTQQQKLTAVDRALTLIGVVVFFLAIATIIWVTASQH